MDVGIQEAFIVVGALLILAILLDAIRRLRNSRRDRIGMSIPLADDDDLYTSELPNGGARVVGQSAVERREPNFNEEEQGNLEFGQVPTLMDSVGETSFSASNSSQQEKTAPEKSDSPAAAASPQHVIVINVLAEEGQEFAGSDLLRVVLGCNLRFGDMDIFHRYEEGDDGKVQFSMANVVKPGTFDLERMKDFNTKGVCFFMSLPGPKNELQALDDMVNAARRVGNGLGGELFDQSHSMITRQTIEHYRQQVLDFRRRQLTS